ncbi:recombination regulator RecX [Clostridium sp. LIBA-8841]|uniref:recombination regulator RecX n=1 Tax=Clostridium sp. LIBA-8841 TaxID=2987530 RepID=UPI002AC4CF60|nr:recombination regulator RecX [Clostridium sp. LIBA-8841]MDZ5252865.1 recombination regulator RecX [Clostridium sp. LIBA-8841]
MGKITSIEVQKRNTNRVNVYVDEVFTFACDAELIYKQGIQKDVVIDVESIKEIVKEDEFIKCKNSALRTVEKTYKTEKELKDKLLGRGFEEDTIRKAIDFLKEYNLLNDEKYAEMYIKDRLRTQGRNKIKYALIRKGISEEILLDKLSNVDEEDENDTAFKLAEKKYNILKKKESDKYKLSQKLFRFLLSKGYDYDCCNSVVRRLTNNEYME